MFKGIGWGLDGHVVIQVSGSRLTDFVNTALGRGILLWDIRRDGQDQLFARVRARGVRELRHVAAATGCRFVILEKVGPAFWWQRLSKRKFMAVGFVIALIVLHILSGFVWSIQVVGNKLVPVDVILQAAAGGGLTWGMPGRSLQSTRVEKAIMAKVPQVAWVSIQLNGTAVRLEVVERALPEPVSDRPADIVASRAGLIKDVLVQKGRAAVRPGETVRPGQVLISGTIEPPPEGTVETRYVAARGLVRARVWYESYGEAHLQITGQRPTGSEESSYSIKIGGREIISIGPGRSPFPLFRTETLTKTFTLWRNIDLPVELVTTRYMEYESFREVRDVETARRLATEIALFDLESKRYLPGTVVDSRVEQVGLAGQDNVVRERMQVEDIEDIGMEQPLSLLGADGESDRPNRPL